MIKRPYVLFTAIAFCAAAFAQELSTPDPLLEEQPSAEAVSQAEDELLEVKTEPVNNEFAGGESNNVESANDEPPPAEAADDGAEDERAESEIEAEQSEAEVEPANDEPAVLELSPVLPVRQAEAAPAIQIPEPDAGEIMPEGGGKPTVAIYMAGEEPAGVSGVHNILGGELARTISESDKYLAVDRTEAIIHQLNREHIYQRSGSVSDDQIKSLGQRLGAQYLCISNLNAVGKKSYYLDVRLVDVVTAEIIRTATATSSLKDANEMTRAARGIAYELIENEKAKEQRKRKKQIFLYTGIGLDILGAGAVAYGIIENNNVKKFVDSEDYPDADSAKDKRDIAYIAGGVLLAGGITIHILF